MLSLLAIFLFACSKQGEESNKGKSLYRYENNPCEKIRENKDKIGYWRNSILNGKDLLDRIVCLEKYNIDFSFVGLKQRRVTFWGQIDNVNSFQID